MATPAGGRAEAGSFALMRFMRDEGMVSGLMDLHPNGETESQCEMLPRGCYEASPSNRDEQHPSPTNVVSCCHTSCFLPLTLGESFPLCGPQFPVTVTLD